MSAPKVLFGFHAVGVRLKTAPQSIVEIYFEPTRRDARMRQFLERAREASVRLIEADGLRLAKLAGSHGHQGVAARVTPLETAHSLDDLLDQVQGPPLLLVLDGVTDPHNLGACLRVADGAGAHAVIAPKDHAVGVNATVAKVASGAAETVPYFMVTNLARTLGELKERSIWCVGASDDAPRTIYQSDFKGPLALVLGAEGSGLRQLTRQTLRRTGVHPDARRRRKPERVGGQRRVPVRGAAAALMSKVLQVLEWVRAARRIAVLTGAGMSAESGVPTFRDAQTGLWAKFDPQQLATEEAYRADPAMVWQWYVFRREMIAKVQPNAGHRALAEFAQRHPGRLTLITQNVDGLHQRAGSAGCAGAAREHCRGPVAACGAGLLPAAGHLVAGHVRRAARCCGNLRRPAVVWFGEALPAPAFAGAERAAQDCDLMLVVGTSGVVYPAAGLARMARGKVAVVNPEADGAGRCSACRAARHGGRAVATIPGGLKMRLPALVRALAACIVWPCCCRRARRSSRTSWVATSRTGPVPMACWRCTPATRLCGAS